MKFSVLDRSGGVARACPSSITRVVDCRGVGSMARRGPRRGAAIGVPRRARFGARPPRPARSPVSAGWVAGDRDPGDRGGDGLLRRVRDLGGYRAESVPPPPGTPDRTSSVSLTRLILIVNHPEFYAPSGFCEPAGWSVPCSE